MEVQFMRWLRDTEGDIKVSEKGYEWAPLSFMDLESSLEISTQALVNRSI